MRVLVEVVINMLIDGIIASLRLFFIRGVSHEFCCVAVMTETPAPGSIH